MPGAGEAAEGTPKRLLGRATQAVAQILSKEGYLGEIWEQGGSASHTGVAERRCGA